MNQVKLPENFQKEYPQFKDFRFWEYNGKMVGQAQHNHEYYGHKYIFDFENKIVMPVMSY